MFCDSKGKSTYLVCIQGEEIEVEHVHTHDKVQTGLTIATTLQTIGNTKMQLEKPADPVQFFKDYLSAKGWLIEDID